LNNYKESYALNKQQMSMEPPNYNDLQ